MREPIVNGLRLGLGVAIIGTLLAETKLSNQGLGYLVIQAYALVRHAADVRAPPRRFRHRDRLEYVDRLRGAARAVTMPFDEDGDRSKNESCESSGRLSDLSRAHTNVSGS